MNQNNKMNALCSKLYNLLEFINCSMLLSTDWKYDNQWLNTACLNKKKIFLAEYLVAVICYEL